MDVFESAPAAALLGVTFASRVQTPTDASKRASLILLSDFEFGRLAAL
jgi:hypothetical protein